MTRTAADLNHFSFANVKSMDDEMMLPGALKYGDLTTLVGLAAPHELLVFNVKGVSNPNFLPATYRAAGGEGKLRGVEEQLATSEILAWLMR